MAYQEFKNNNVSEKKINRRKYDAHVEKLLKEVFTGMQGRYTRIRIIKLLIDMPLNTNQIAEKLSVDYGTIQHNIRVLESKNMISRVGGKYGGLFFISTFLENNLEKLNKIVKNSEIKHRNKSCVIDIV